MIEVEEPVFRPRDPGTGTTVSAVSRWHLRTSDHGVLAAPAPFFPAPFPIRATRCVAEGP